MKPIQVLSEKGDFIRIAASMRNSGEGLINQLALAKNNFVLDLDDRTTAIPATKLGTKVLGVDIARNLAEAGNIHAENEGLSNIVFEPCNLNSLSDQSFDSSLSAMFTPKPGDLAKELVRITKPDGRIPMGIWIPAIITTIPATLMLPKSEKTIPG